MASNCPYWKVGNCEPPHATSIHPCSYSATDYAECAVHQYTVAKDGGASTADALRSAGALSPFARVVVVGSSAPTTGRPPPIIQSDTDLWTCPNCGLENPPDWDVCACGRDKNCAAQPPSLPTTTAKPPLIPVSESPKLPPPLPAKDSNDGFPLDQGYSRLKIQALLPKLELDGPLVCAICGASVSDNACLKKQIFALSNWLPDKKLYVVVRLCNEHDYLANSLWNYIRIRQDIRSIITYHLLEIGNPEVAVQYQRSINAHMEALAKCMEEQSQRVWFGKKKYQALKIVALEGRVKSIIWLRPGDEGWVGLEE